MESCRKSRADSSLRPWKRAGASAAGRPWKPRASKPESPALALTWTRRTWRRRFWTTGAISYTKGCYIGQEVIARVRTYGQPAKSLRGLRLPDNLRALPIKGDKLFLGEKEAGYITSAVASPRLKTSIALGYVRREANQTGTELLLQMPHDKVPVKIVELPFLNRFVLNQPRNSSTMSQP